MLLRSKNEQTLQNIYNKMNAGLESRTGPTADKTVPIVCPMPLPKTGWDETKNFVVMRFHADTLKLNVQELE